MADTYTLPVLTDADINGIVTAGQDGTYNITYTNLTANQIAEIGAAFEQAMKNNLKPVAINNGDYDDLTKKPIIPNGYTEESAFNKIAFSGKASDLNNDSGFLTTNTNAYTNSPASNITNRDIENWNNKSDFDDSVLSNIALSGNYNDLINPPSYQANQYNFSNVAFTGNFFDLESIPESLNGIIYFNNFINNNNVSETNKILTLGDQDTYILDFLNFQSDLGYLLPDVVMTMATNFLQSGKLYFFTNINRRYLITNIVRYLNNNNIETPAYVKMEYAISNIDNYEPYSGNNFSDSIAATQLDDLTLLQKTGYLIFDYINNVIYCKVKNII